MSTRQLEHLAGAHNLSHPPETVTRDLAQPAHDHFFFRLVLVNS
jgi:hypothetical protein